MEQVAAAALLPHAPRLCRPAFRLLAAGILARAGAELPVAILPPAGAGVPGRGRGEHRLGVDEHRPWGQDRPWGHALGAWCTSWTRQPATQRPARPGRVDYCSSSGRAVI